MSTQLNNFTERALAWAAAHPTEDVLYMNATPVKAREASLHNYQGWPDKYFVGDHLCKSPLIEVIEDWEELLREQNRVLDKTRLPYEFDLMFDIKYMYEVEMVCEGKCPAGTSATPEDLYEMFVRKSMAVPKYLEDAAGTSPLSRTVWIGIDGSWLSYQPLPDEINDYMAVKVTPTPEFIKVWEIRTGRKFFD